TGGRAARRGLLLVRSRPTWPGPIMSVRQPSAGWQRAALSSKARPPSNEARAAMIAKKDQRGLYGQVALPALRPSIIRIRAVAPFPACKVAPFRFVFLVFFVCADEDSSAAPARRRALSPMGWPDRGYPCPGPSPRFGYNVP